MTNRTRTLLAAAVATASLLAGCNDKGGAAPATTAAPNVTASAAPQANGKPAAKVFDCGGGGQRPCPMQIWMKTVMADASSSGDGERLAKALTYAADHAPPGYAGWSAIASQGAERARAGEVDAAKASCRQCHEAYKENYQAAMRDRAF